MSAIRIEIEKVVVDAGVDARGLGEAVRVAIEQHIQRHGAPPAAPQFTAGAQVQSGAGGAPQAVAAVIWRALRGGTK